MIFTRAFMGYPMSRKNTKQLILLLMVSLIFTACSKEEFFEKDYLNNDNTDNDGFKLITINDTFPRTIGESKIDILWVVDNSRSMRGEQDDLANNFDLFINDFIKKDVDFKMAITTTDARVSYNGTMEEKAGCAPLTSVFAKDNRNEFVECFKDMITVGIGGSGSEQGLKTSTSFIDKYGSSFLRDDAYLIVVIVSDEEDQSPLNIDNYLTIFRTLKSNPGMVKVYSIINTLTHPSTDIKDPPYNYYFGQRYTDVSKATGGIIADIKDSFVDTLLNMGEQIILLINSFPLTQIPYNGVTTVYIDDVLTTTGWTYDNSSNIKAIRFKKDTLPSNKSVTIKVEYKVKDI